jgi:hypothetical protein
LRIPEDKALACENIDTTEAEEHGVTVTGFWVLQYNVFCKRNFLIYFFCYTTYTAAQERLSSLENS